MDQLGQQSFAAMKEKLKVNKDPIINGYVQCVAKLIVNQTEAKNKKWEIVVFEDDTANAFALPGEKIAVHTGLLKVAKTQDQLAAVLGHEVGHVMARHGNERVSQGLATQGALILTSVLTKDTPKRDWILALMGVGAQVGYLLPHSRQQEAEADEIGLKYMAAAGFDPEQSIELWKNMSQASQGEPPEFLSTHPSHGSRIDHLARLMPEAKALQNRAKVKPPCHL